MKRTGIMLSMNFAHAQIFIGLAEVTYNARNIKEMISFRMFSPLPSAGGHFVTLDKTVAGTLKQSSIFSETMAAFCPLPTQCTSNSFTWSISRQECDLKMTFGIFSIYGVVKRNTPLTVQTSIGFISMRL
jgi:hypothetical protein